MSLVLRSNINRRLTVQEMDGNFTYLENLAQLGSGGGVIEKTYSELVDLIQIVDMNKGGKIAAHYDASIGGIINYKCNISVLSDDYDFFIDKEKINIKEKDMYCFEASLYKHWTEEFNNRRVFLSFGFLVPYSTTNRTENDPRVRLSKRIERYFMK